jgi:hypothetical protein
MRSLYQLVLVHQLHGLLLHARPQQTRVDNFEDGVVEVVRNLTRLQV